MRGIRETGRPVFRNRCGDRARPGGLRRRQPPSRSGNRALRDPARHRRRVPGLEWKLGPVLSGGTAHVRSDLEPVEGRRPVGTPGTAGTAADLSGRFSIRWDDDWIYLAADVTDNVHDVSGGTSLTWYLKDAIALYLDVPDDGDGGEWILGDHAFAFVADPSGPGDGRWWRRGEAEGSEESQAPPETRMGVVLTETGYRIEAAIPMGPLTERTPEWRPPFAGRSAGFFLLAADPDGGAEEVIQILYGGDDDNDANWATLRFVETHGPSPESTGPGPVLGRLVAHLSTERAGEFPEAFDAALLPVLERHGFQAVEPPLSASVDPWYTRFFTAPGTTMLRQWWADVETDPAWIAAKVALAPYGPRGDGADPSIAPRALTASMHLYSSPAGGGIATELGPGKPRHIEPVTVRAGAGLRTGVWWNLGVPDGVPPTVDILQDEEGALWLATDLGVSRFDGVHVTSYEVSKGPFDEFVLAIHRDREGNLRVARGRSTSNGKGGGLSRFDGEHWRDFDVEDGLGHTTTARGSPRTPPDACGSRPPGGSAASRETA